MIAISPGVQSVEGANRTRTVSLGNELKLCRLQQRAHRIERVLLALATRAREHDRARGVVPPALRATTADFEAELERVFADVETLQTTG